MNEIIDDVKNRYAKVLIITKSCDQGIGKIIRGRCLDKNFGKPEFDMLEISLRHYLIQELTKSEFQINFDSLNNTLLALGDEFHLIVEDFPRGSMYDLLKKVHEAKLPYALYRPDELKSGPKQPFVPEEGSAVPYYVYP